MLVCITGANGFVGRTLCSLISGEGIKIRALVRDARAGDVRNGPEELAYDLQAVGDLSVGAGLFSSLQGVDCVVHCAGDSGANCSDLHRNNVMATVNLVNSSVRAGVKKIIYISTVKVLGESSIIGLPFSSDDRASPQTPYAISKWQAETRLHSLTRDAGVQSIIIRPPLIYGPGVKGNIQTLIRLIRLGLPLPFGAIKNKRSFLNIWNLANLINYCISSKGEFSKPLIISDGDSLSTPDLITLIANCLGRSPRLFSIDERLLLSMADLTKKGLEIRKLVSSLEVDSTVTCNDIGWRPNLSTAQGILKMITEQK